MRQRDTRSREARPVLGVLRRTRGLLLLSVASLFVILCVPWLSTSALTPNMCHGWTKLLSDDADDEGAAPSLAHEVVTLVAAPGALACVPAVAAVVEADVAVRSLGVVDPALAPRAPPLV